MKSTGEVMSIVRIIEEALNKAIRSLDIGKFGFEDTAFTRDNLANPTDEGFYQIYTALKEGTSVNEINNITKIDKLFLYKIKNIVDLEKEINSENITSHELLLKAKHMGFSDKQLAKLTDKSEAEIGKLRKELDITPVYKMVDTCAAEFEAKTPYYYSTYEDENEAKDSDNRKFIILGAGPICIDQGIEFDYCCVHSSLALKEEGIETIVINNNLETISIDYDISSKLYFEPLTFEDVMNVIETEKPEGVVVQFGGQTSINLAVPLAKQEVKIMGTPHESIDHVEDRELFTKVLEKLHMLLLIPLKKHMKPQLELVFQS